MTTNNTEGKKEIGEWQTCPRCGGQGTVSKPPWVPGDIHEWVTSTAVSYPCPVCRGAKVLARPIIKPTNDKP